MSLDLIIRVGTKLILPFILLFALYVQLHGDYGPGGGFQAGVITAGMVILLAITFGLQAAQRIAPQPLVERMIPLGVLIFIATGIGGLIMGKNYLDYSGFSSEPARGHELGIFLVEAGVLITVASTMIGLFYAFVERERR
jgi:multicomponent Na+:H+ antiporter subunit B